jgi:hypothetical protein
MSFGIVVVIVVYRNVERVQILCILNLSVITPFFFLRHHRVCNYQLTNGILCTDHKYVYDIPLCHTSCAQL